MTNLRHSESTAAHGNLAMQHGEPADVLQRTRTFLATQGLSLADCVLIECQHTEDITHVTRADKAKTIPTEALLTNEPGVVLFLLTGDCFPVSYHDPVFGVVGLAHLGWKPTDKKLAAKVVREMVRMYGSDPKNIKVHIGSGISADSYVFVEAEQQGQSEWANFVHDLPSGEVSVDLAGYIKQQLQESCINPANISQSSIDTATSPERFSFYRSVRSGEPQARFATVVTLIK
jgi:copper oxidase (laccase) domain-containing protein